MQAAMTTTVMIAAIMMIATTPPTAIPIMVDVLRVEGAPVSLTVGPAVCMFVCVCACMRACVLFLKDSDHACILNHLSHSQNKSQRFLEMCKV